ncbi:MAG TPA: hypothetical protein VLC50_03735 [Actinomycetes bacterium]|nr:hypothetical protein [Actinomycetes bacterium]
MNDDRGDIILGWLAKVVVTLALVGLVIFDLISIGWTKVSLTDQAKAAAISASTAWAHGHNVQKAYDAALAQATEDNAANTVATEGFTVDPDGTVHLRLDREASTIVVSRIGPIRDWGQLTATASGRDVTG